MSWLLRRCLPEESHKMMPGSGLVCGMLLIGRSHAAFVQWAKRASVSYHVRYFYTLSYRDQSLNPQANSGLLPSLFKHKLQPMQRVQQLAHNVAQYHHRERIESPETGFTATSRAQICTCSVSSCQMCVLSSDTGSEVRGLAHTFLMKDRRGGGGVGASHGTQSH